MFIAQNVTIVSMNGQAELEAEPRINAQNVIALKFLLPPYNTHK